MEQIRLRKGKLFYYTGLVILLILIIGLIVSLIAFRSFLSHRILPFTLLFLFTIGAMYADFLERKIKKKRYERMLQNLNKIDEQTLLLMLKELFKRSGYKVKKINDKHYKFILKQGINKYYFTIGKNKPNSTNFKKDENSIYFYMGIKNTNFQLNSDKVIVLDFEDLKMIVDKVI